MVHTKSRATTLAPTNHAIHKIISQIDTIPLPDRISEHLDHAPKMKKEANASFSQP
jgi:hypothetical protein